MKKIVFITLLVLTKLALAQELVAGNYKGNDSAGKKVDFLIKAASQTERNGSFYGVLIQNDKEISLYVIDQLDTRYVLTPLSVADDGYIGISNDDPSLVLTVTGKDRQGVEFTLTSANSTNTNGAKGTFTFNSTSEKNWMTATPGTFGKDGNRSALIIGQSDRSGKMFSAVLGLSNISGNFILSEKLPGMYLLNAQSVLSTGQTTTKTPKAVGIFIQKSGWGGYNNFYLINPANYKDVAGFEKDGGGSSRRSYNNESPN